jgi:hypothetical protein
MEARGLVGIYATGMSVCLDSGRGVGVVDGLGNEGVRQSVEDQDQDQDQEKESIEDFIRRIEKVSQGYEELPPVDTFFR